jgi:hypothetical protein
MTVRVRAVPRGCYELDRIEVTTGGETETYRVRRILEELLGGTGYEFLAGLAEDAVRGRRPRGEGLSRRQARIAESLGLL